MRKTCVGVVLAAVNVLLVSVTLAAHHGAASLDTGKEVTLEKRQPVSLQKEDGKFGEIIINLNWSRPAVKAGGIGSLFGRKGGSGGVDLDLGAMLEHRNGLKGVVQVELNDGTVLSESNCSR